MSKRKYTVLDLFCGCGGISEGYSLAGFDIVGGIDFNEYATITFKHNFKKAKVHNLLENFNIMSSIHRLKYYPWKKYAFTFF